MELLSQGAEAVRPALPRPTDPTRTLATGDRTDGSGEGARARAVGLAKGLRRREGGRERFSAPVCALSRLGGRVNGGRCVSRALARARLAVGLRVVAVRLLRAVDESS